MFKSINPYTEETIFEFHVATDQELLQHIESSRKAFEHWRWTTIPQRQDLFLKLDRELREELDSLSHLVSLEMGKPVAESREEIQKCASLCYYYAQSLPEIARAQEIEAADFKSAQVSYQPLGVILGVMPWNFPFWQVFRFAIPTLAMGNAVLIKHAPNTQSCASRIYTLFEEVGFPHQTYNHVACEVSQVEKIIAHRAVAGVSLTGSTLAGRSVASLAGKHLKKSVLELGGSDPYIVFADADLSLAARICVQSRFMNGGQSCIAAKRFIVHKDVHDEFIKLFIDEILKRHPGNPLDAKTLLGPLARRDLRDQVAKQVERSVREGAHVLWTHPEFPLKNHPTGFFYPPTILDNVKVDSTAFREEIFGPVAAITTFETEEEAVHLANQSHYGLGAAIFSQDVERAEELLRNEIQAGLCFVNGQVRSDVRWPFGGVKDSGYGRELGAFGALEFVNVKSVLVC